MQAPFLTMNHVQREALLYFVIFEKEGAKYVAVYNKAISAIKQTIV